MSDLIIVPNQLTGQLTFLNNTIIYHTTLNFALQSPLLFIN